MNAFILLWSVILILTTTNADSAPKSEFTAVPAPELDSLFYNNKGWIGADGDYSVPLGKDKILWLFSDTFVGDVTDGQRKNCVMINNSAAIQHLGKNPSVEFHYKTGSDGSAQTLITPSEGQGYFWIFGSVLTSKGLYMFMPRIINVDNGTGFPFKGIGMTVGHVKNYNDPPEKWNVIQRELPFSMYGDDGSLYFGSSIMKDGEYIYIYGLDGNRKDKNGKRMNAMIVARVPEDKFGEFDEWRFYNKGAWGKDYNQCEALGDGMSTEYSVFYLPYLKQYASVYTAWGISGVIVMRLSSKPEGPWGEPVTIFDCPDKHWHEKAFSYAAKGHPELSQSEDELIISYATNSTHYPDLFEDARLYWPRFVRLKLDMKEE